jgi:RimJ/RimL family protein N-acetyltransferase
MTELRFPQAPLADELVALRRWRGSDVPGQLMRFADPLVQRFSWPATTRYTEEDARRYFAEQVQAGIRGEQLDFALTEPSDDDVVLGGISLYGVDLDEDVAGVGFWLTPEARGRGVATHAVKLAAHWAFEELGLARLELTTAPENEASQAVARRCGFVREGVLRSRIRFKNQQRDSVIFSLLPEDLSI